MEAQGKFISKDEFMTLCKQISKCDDPVNCMKISYDALFTIRHGIERLALDEDTIDILVKHGKSNEVIRYLNLVITTLANMIITSPEGMQDYMDMLNAAKPIVIKQRTSNEIYFFGPRLPISEIPAHSNSSNTNIDGGGMKSYGTVAESK